MTQTLIDQANAWDMCEKCFEGPSPVLLVDRHLAYLAKLLDPLPSGFIALDASRPWTVYWPLNALALLKLPVSSLADQVAASVLAYQSKPGGFGGGVGQAGHLASSYAAILALAYSPEAWNRIDRTAMYNFLMARKQPCNGFSVCDLGEVDPRGTYTALCIASLLNIASPELLDGVGEYIASCQTYEGGFANTPNGEAHGGYAFCALATLFFVGDPAKYIDVEKFIGWLAKRQDAHGGLSGRTNKLVDGCYSHWVGNCWPLVEQLVDASIVSKSGLREFILRCCQNPRGGLRDKPDCKPDAYHSNYVLCGLSGVDYLYKMDGIYDWQVDVRDTSETPSVQPINPLLCLPLGVGEEMHAHFCNL